MNIKGMLLSLLLAILILSPHSCAVIRKVAIVGSGPAGLSLGVSLQRMTSVEEIMIYESRKDPSQSVLGGGVQLTSGAAVLQKLGLGAVLNERAERISAGLCYSYSCS